MNIDEQILKFFVEECFQDKDLDKSEKLFSTGKLDSLDFVDLLSFLEKQFLIQGEKLDRLSHIELDTVSLISSFVKIHKDTKNR